MPRIRSVNGEDTNRGAANYRCVETLGVDSEPTSSQDTEVPYILELQSRTSATSSTCSQVSPVFAQVPAYTSTL
ncbi:hypothetical protein D7X30_33665 [Corallococcus sp. AB011P]|nr:hypothetical protein D7X30_33665 [Corallococcus sp. AB011P]